MAGTVRGVVAAAHAVDRAIVVLASIAFISQLGVSMMLPLLPLFAVQLGATPSELGLMVSIFAVTQTIGQLGSGAIIGRISPRRQLPLGQASYAAANFLIATATSALPLIVFRSLAGLGGGLSIIAERLYVARVADRARLAFTNGVLSASGSAGSVLGPTIAAVLAINLRIPFIVVGVTASLAAIGAILFLPAERAPTVGAAPTVPEARPDAGAVAGSNATTASGAALEVDTAPARAAAPGSASWWLRHGTLAALFLWNLSFSAAYGGWITAFAPFTTQRLGMAAGGVALVFSFFGIGSIVLGPALARVADRTGRRRMVAVGTGLVLVFFAAALAGVPPIGLYAAAVVSGGGLAAAQSSWFALLTVATDGGRRGRSFGFVTALSNLGVIAGASLASQVWERVGIAEGLATAALFLVIGIASLALVRSDPRPA
jgi:MFS family permease